MIYIVAEIGVNWNGDFEILEKMISKSKNAGCNAVKFQSFNLEQIKSHPEADKLLRASISEKNVGKINQIAMKHEIEWFCTPMYPEIVKILEPYVKRFKLRELDGREIVKNNQTPLAKAVLDSGKKVIISSQESPKNCKFHTNEKIEWLYCVPKYPCRIEDMSFEKIQDFDGYSNHCLDSIIPISAAILGAKIIEIHVTLDKNGEYIDNNVSFEFDELEKIVRDIRKIERLKK